MNSDQLLNILDEGMNHSLHKKYFVDILKDIGEKLKELKLPEELYEFIEKLETLDTFEEEEQKQTFRQFKLMMNENRSIELISKAELEESNLRKHIQQNWRMIENKFLIENCPYTLFENWMILKYTNPDVTFNLDQTIELIIEFLEETGYKVAKIVKKGEVEDWYICLKDEESMLIGQQSNFLTFESLTTVEIIRNESNLIIRELSIEGFGKSGMVLEDEEELELQLEQVFRLGESVLVIIGLEEDVLVLEGYTPSSGFEVIEECTPENEEYKIGKDENCEIFFSDDQNISDFHAKIKFDREKWFIKSLDGSTVCVLFHEYEKEDIEPSPSALLPHRCQLMIDKVEIDLIY